MALPAILAKLTGAALYASLMKKYGRTDMLEEEVKPLKGHVLKAQGILVFIGVLSSLVAVGVSVLNIIKTQ
jgi:hypothetical protein